MPTQKQKNLIHNLSININNPKETKTQKQLLIDSGYKPSTAQRSTEIIQSPTIQKAIRPIIRKLDREKKRILQELSMRDLTNEKYFILTKSFDILTKNSQLLSGRSTDNIAILDVTKLETAIRTLAEEQDDKQ